MEESIVFKGSDLTPEKIARECLVERGGKIIKNDGVVLYGIFSSKEGIPFCKIPPANFSISQEYINKQVKKIKLFPPVLKNIDEENN